MGTKKDVDDSNFVPTLWGQAERRKQRRKQQGEMMFLEQRLESLDQKLQTIEAKLSSLDEKVTAILEMEASKPQGDNQPLKDMFDSFKKNWAGDSPDMQNLKSQLEKVKSSLGNLTENLVAASDSNSTSVK